MDFTDFVQEMFSRDFDSSARKCLDNLAYALPAQTHAVLEGIIESACHAGRGIDLRRIPEKLDCGPRADGTDKSGAVNTFPFGEPTNEVYPNYIGVTWRSKSLSKVLDDAERHCWRLSRMQKPYAEKTVIILTDRWDCDRFRRYYEKDFMRYAMRDNILFVFLLITEYGITQIPFLPLNPLSRKEKAKVYMGSAEVLEDPILKELCSISGFCLDIVERGGIHKSYSFRFCSRSWSYKEDPNGEGGAFSHGVFISSDLNGFAADVADFYETFSGTPSEHPKAPQGGSCNYDITYTAIMHDGTYSWYEGDEEYQKMEDAFNMLIQGLDPVG